MKPSFQERFRHALQRAALRPLSIRTSFIVCAASAKPTAFGLLLGAATLLLTSLPATSAVYYRITDLGLSKFATSINDAGEVAGFADTGDTGFHAFHWTPAGGIQYLAGLSGGSAGFVHGINNAGQIVGESSSRIGSRAFRWTPGLGFLDLGGLPGHHSQVGGINNAGEAAGSTINLAGAHRAVRWSADGIRQDLGALPGGDNYSEATAINNAGQVAGLSNVGRNSHAFLWSAAGGMQDLGDLGGVGHYSSATAINDVGQVAGSSYATGNRAHAFLWSPGSGMQDLGALPEREDLSIANGMNNAGQVVGSSGGAATAFLWTASGGMQELDALIDPRDPLKDKIHLESAEDINNIGQIVVGGRDLMGFGTHAYLLTSIPQLDTQALLLVGLSLTAMMVRRRQSRTSSFRLRAGNGARSARPLGYVAGEAAFHSSTSRRTHFREARENFRRTRFTGKNRPLEIAMRNALALLLLVLSFDAQATLWRVDAVLSAYGLSYEYPYQKTRFPVQGAFDTEDGEPLWWDIDVTLPGYVLSLDSAACNPYSNYCSGTSIRGGFRFGFSYGSPGGSWYLTLVSAGVLTSAEFYRGGSGGFEGELEHGTMITVDIPEPSTSLFVLVALGFVVARACPVFVKAAEGFETNQGVLES